MSNIFENMMKMYEESHTKSSSKSTKQYDLKNYFSTYLPKGINEATKRIRILPPEEGQSVPWTIMKGHKIQLPNGDYKTYACLKEEEGKPCPFCEARELLWSTGEQSDKDLAKTYSTRTMYVVKVIDRDKPEEGVKFWRFNHDYRKTGTLDKIMGVIKAVGHDISDPNTGRDLIVNIARDMNNTPVVQSINYPIDSTPLSDDVTQGKAWLADERTWRDVYSIKSYEFLKIVVKGDIPVWDKEAEKYVGQKEMEEKKAQAEASIDDDDSELTIGGATEVVPTTTVETPTATATETTTTTTVETTTTPTPEAVTATPQAAEEEDDLPF